MQLKIKKIQKNKLNYLNRIAYYESAREGFLDLLQTLIKDDKLLNKIYLPDYIGLSAREGSGIFDPIIKSGIEFEFYSLDSHLNINVDLLRKAIDNNSDNFIFLIVNYFGFYDNNYFDVLEYVKSKNAIIIEDNAHGYFSYLRSNRKSADFTFFSYHKLLPFDNGGAIEIINPEYNCLKLSGHDYSHKELYHYNYTQISKIRRRNYELLIDIINDKKYKNLFQPLHSNLKCDCVPQTFPLIILKGNRDMIYHQLNGNGFGVVSLYHTLIPQLRDKNSISYNLSKRILNLPVHQDVDTSFYHELIDNLYQICTENE